MSFIRQVVKASCRAVIPRRMFMTCGPSPGRLPGAHKGCHEVALTFDDGPDPDITPKLLDLLEKWQISATFFVIGEKVVRHRDIVHRIASAGHGLGNHSYTHSEPHKTSTRQFLDEVRKTRDLLEDIGNQPCKLVRPPKGKLTVGKQIGLWKQGMSIALWNIDPRDYQMQSQQQAVDWGASYHPRGGDIVLLHDNHPWAADIVRVLANNNYQAGCVRYVRLSEWVQR